MQLLIDTSDIHNYRDRCRKWADGLAQYVLNNSQQPFGMDEPKRTYPQLLADYEKLKPFPTVLPTDV